MKQLVNIRGRFLGVTITLPLVLCFCFGMLIFVNPPLYGPFWTAAQNTAHLILFSAMSILLIAIVDKGSTSPFVSKLFVVLIPLLLVGVLAEIVQLAIPGRTASMGDLILNLLGVLVGVSAYCIFHFRKVLGWLWCTPLVVLLIALFLWNCRPVLEVIAYAFLKSDPPVLVSFSDPFVSTMITPAGGATASPIVNFQSAERDLGGALRMNFSKERFSRVILHEPSGPWDDYKYLVLSAFNESQQVKTLNFRIDDVHHNEFYEDRYKGSMQLLPGLTTVRLPIETVELVWRGSKSRRMDMQNLAQIQFFSILEEDFTVYLLDLKFDN